MKSAPSSVQTLKPLNSGRGGQIDLVCRDGETLVFVEVKSLTGADRIRPLDHLRADQKPRIFQGALTWLRLLDNPDISFGFDVVEILFRAEEFDFQLIQDAFQLSKPFIYEPLLRSMRGQDRFVTCL